MGTSYSWHPGAKPVNPRWQLTPAILPDELISSWLLRTALKFGCEPKTLTQQIWPTWRIWNTDPDRGFNAERIQLLAEASGVPHQSLQQTSIRWIAEKVTSKPLYDKQTWKWVLALGNRGNLRKGGLQYCPHCFLEDTQPYYRISWRLAWHVGCVRHYCSLYDRCWRCDAPLEPYRLTPQDADIAVCGRCKTDLRAAQHHEPNNDAIAFQKLADQTIQANSGMIFNQTTTAPTWFDMADFFSALIRQASRSIGHCALADFIHEATGKNPQDAHFQHGACIELLKNQDRQAILALLYRIMSLDRNFLIELLHQSRVSRLVLCPKNVIVPYLISDIAEQLPAISMTQSITPSKHITNSPRQRNKVIRMMKRLLRKLDIIKS